VVNPAAVKVSLQKLIRALEPQSDEGTNVWGFAVKSVYCEDFAGAVMAII
jgi:hypothetical protein